MHTDMRHKLTISLIIALIPLLLSAVMIFGLASGALMLMIFPLIMFAAGFVVLFILGFVPFMKDHMWLSVTAVVILCALAGFLVEHFS